jgi:hypothetical protein
MRSSIIGADSKQQAYGLGHEKKMLHFDLCGSSFGMSGEAEAIHQE